MIAPSGGPMRWLTDLVLKLSLMGVLGALVLLLLPESSAAQSGGQALPDTRGIKDYASIGQITFQIQDAAGAPFFEGATIKLLTSQIDTTMFTTSDQVGKARFTALPAGRYVVEIVAPGYRTVQEQ